MCLLAKSKFPGTEIKQIQNNDLWELGCKHLAMIGQWRSSVTNQVSFNLMFQLPLLDNSFLTIQKQYCVLPNVTYIFHKGNNRSH